MVRHRSFKDPLSLLAAVRDLVPSHVYFSTAYYREPTAPMEEKGWIGADLVFDIDADHLNTPCKPDHDNWKCKSCGTTGNGGGTKLAEGPLMGQPGWRGRIVAGIYDILGSEMDQIGLTSTQVNALKSWDREDLLRKPFWSSVKGVGISTWKTLVSKAVEKKSARIDTVVTTDIHRLIRMPGTLNGHTGLLAMRVPEERLDEFDPFTEPMAFQGEMRVKVKESPGFRLGEERFGPYHDETLLLPSTAAMLLLCKHRAEPIA